MAKIKESRFVRNEMIFTDIIAFVDFCVIPQINTFHAYLFIY